jgi:selenocysteine-specific elongation factor
MALNSVIVGTAGHIDHGKTSLVKALTGIDADRLAEEKERGITIDIGFAHLELKSPDGRIFRFGFVDVPGHERFVRNMLTGIGGIDIVLLVIAADEGIKPQTREHFDICRMLCIQHGMTVLTKADLVDAERLEAVRREVTDFVRGSFLEHAPILPLSSQTGAGLNELKTALVEAAARAEAKDSGGIVRLPIDRVFTMKGFGSVITGTLVSGMLHKEDELEVFPSREHARVRGLQVHGAPAESARAGERTALNLAGINKEDLARGMTLAAPGRLRATGQADVRLTLLQDAKPLKDRARVHFHAFTSEVIAELRLLGSKSVPAGGSAYAELRFAEPVLLLPGDRFIIRQFSPLVTLGGGAVLDAHPLKGKVNAKARETFLHQIEDGNDEQHLKALIARRGQNGLAVSEAVAETGWTDARLHRAKEVLAASGEVVAVPGVLLASAEFERAGTAAVEAVKRFHDENPLVSGINKEELRERLRLSAAVFSEVLHKLVRDKQAEVSGEQVRVAGRSIIMKDDEAEAKQTIEKAFASAGLKVPAMKEVMAGLPLDKSRAQKIVTLLLRDRVLVKLADDLVFHQGSLQSLRQLMQKRKADGHKTIDVAAFKELTGISRKYAIPLLEFLDRERVTRREGDKRVLL